MSIRAAAILHASTLNGQIKPAPKPKPKPKESKK